MAAWRNMEFEPQPVPSRGRDIRSRPSLATAKRSRPSHALGEAEMVWEERDRERDASAEMERDDRDPAYGASSPWDDAIGREY